MQNIFFLLNSTMNRLQNPYHKNADRRISVYINLFNLILEIILD